MGWAVDANVACGTTRIGNFFMFQNTLYLNAHGGTLYEYAGPGVWNPVLIGGLQAYFGIVWYGRLWATESDNLHYSPDGAVWTLDLDIPLTWGAAYSFRGYGGWDDYLYLANREWLDPVNSIMHFARRTKGGVWTNNVLTQVGVLTATSATTQIIDYNNGDYVFWTSEYNILGDQIWHNGVWSSGPLSLASTRYIIFQNHLFASGAVSFSDPTNDGVFRWSGTHWIEEASFDTSTYSYLSVGDNNELYFATDAAGAGAHIYARNNRAWTLVGTNPGGVPATTATWFNSLLFYLEDAVANQDVMVYAADYNVSVSGLYPQAMDVDGDGDALYIGLIDNATTFPVLVKAPLPLVNTAMGAEVYTGTAGDAINVECPDTGQSIVIAGNFGNNEQVETSDDGGATWTDIDRDAWGAETAQPVLVDPDTTDEVMVALATAQDITETDDAGATAWTVNNAAVGYAIAAMARLPVDSDELVVGNAHAARKVEYSPNRGVELTDITGGAAIGNVVALEVA